MKEKGFLNHYELRRRIFCEKTTVLTNPNPMASKVKAGKNAFGQKFLDTQFPLTYIHFTPEDVLVNHP